MLSFNIPVKKPGTIKRENSIEYDMVRFYMEQRYDIDITKPSNLDGRFDMLKDFIEFLISKRIVLPG